MKKNIGIMFIALFTAPIACNFPRSAAVPTARPTPSVASPTSVPIVQVPTPETISPTQSPESTTQLQQETQGLREICASGNAALILLVDPDYADEIRDSLNQFERDLCQAGYQVMELVKAFANPYDVRSKLIEIYNFTQQRLTGAYLIGDIPHAYQWFRKTYTNPDIPPSEQEVISFQYYADLDGIFSNSPEYVSPGGHPFSFDIHEGEMDWEIWIGVLPVYKGDHQKTVEALVWYFMKNHAYRVGDLFFPRAYLEIDEFYSASTAQEHNQFMAMMVDGQYAWTPFSNSPDAYLFFDSPTAGLSVDQGYQALTEGVADFTSVGAHGTWFASGSIDIDWIESHNVQTIFYNSSGCSSGNLDQPDNFLTSMLYSPTSFALLAWGTTHESGGMGTNVEGFYGHNVASDLSEGKSFGQAILEHVNTPLAYPWSGSRELHFSLQVFLGDPSLTLNP